MNRIIPRLDVKGSNLVKGIHLEGLRILGPIEPFAEYYYTHGADELIYVDAVASLYDRNSLKEIIYNTSKNINIPLCVCGGLRNLKDMEAVLKAGADKVGINTAAIKRPELITEAAYEFGSSTIVINIEAATTPGGVTECFIDNGRQKTGKDVFNWAIQVQELGAGEILLTSVDNEGTGGGFDIELTKSIANQMEIPVIACGGAGNKNDVESVFKKGCADAVSIASILHYKSLKELDLKDLKDMAIGVMADSMNSENRIDSISIEDLKSFLFGCDIDVRMINKTD